jgi:hypothetical protein
MNKREHDLMDKAQHLEEEDESEVAPSLTVVFSN